MELLALPARWYGSDLPVWISDGNELVPIDDILVDALGAVHGTLMPTRNVYVACHDFHPEQMLRPRRPIECPLKLCRIRGVCNVCEDLSFR